MKTCLIAPIPPFRGGIAKYCHSIARELERRHELMLLSYQRQYPQFLYGRGSQIDQSVDRDLVQREFKNLHYDIDSASVTSWIRTSARITDFSPDLVILPWWVVYWTPMYLYLLRVLRRNGIKVLILCINVYEHEDNLLKKFLTRLVLSRADAMIVHSEQERTEILGFNPGATVRKHLLPLFSYRPACAERRDETLNLLFFGFVRPYKGLEILLRAMGMLKERGIFLTIAGEFWKDKAKYLSLIEELGIAGNVDVVDRYVSDDEMSGFFARADLVALPYLKTKTSGIIATAYGYGKPVLVTDVGGFGEVVSDGYTGKIVPPGDPRALAEGIEWFRANREMDFAKNIEEFTARTMSWSSLIDMIEELKERGGG